jgi:hypothetical protein
MSPKNFVTLYYTLGRNPFPGVFPYFLTRKSREISRRAVEKTLDLVKKIQGLISTKPWIFIFTQRAAFHDR